MLKPLSPPPNLSRLDLMAWFMKQVGAGEMDRTLMASKTQDFDDSGWLVMRDLYTPRGELSRINIYWRDKRSGAKVRHLEQLTNGPGQLLGVVEQASPGDIPVPDAFEKHALTPSR